MTALASLALGSDDAHYWLFEAGNWRNGTSGVMLRAGEYMKSHFVDAEGKRVLVCDENGHLWHRHDGAYLDMDYVLAESNREDDPEIVTALRNLAAGDAAPLDPSVPWKPFAFWASSGEDGGEKIIVWGEHDGSEAKPLAPSVLAALRNDLAGDAGPLDPSVPLVIWDKTARQSAIHRSRSSA